MDNRRAQAGRPGHETITALRAAADQQLRDRSIEELEDELLRTPITEWTKVQTEVARRISGEVTRMALDVDKTLNGAEWTRAINIMWRYREARAEQARTLGMIRDTGPRTRMEEVTEILAAPTLSQRKELVKLQRKIRRLRRRIKEGEASLRDRVKELEEELRKKNMRDLRAVRKAADNLRAKGIDPTTLIRADLRDPWVVREMAIESFKARQAERKGIERFTNIDIWLAWRYQSMLSWLGTHARNTVGNTFNTVMEQYVQRGVEGAIAAVFRKFTNRRMGNAAYISELLYLHANLLPNDRRYKDVEDFASRFESMNEEEQRGFLTDTFREFEEMTDEELANLKPAVRHFFSQVSQALTTGWLGFRTNMPAAEFDLLNRGVTVDTAASKIEAAAIRAVPDRYTLGMSWLSSRILQGTDDFAKSFIVQIEANALAMRHAYDHGYKGQEAVYMAHVYLMDPSHGIWQEAHRAALKTTFQKQEATGFENLALQLRREADSWLPIPLGTMLLPFVSTPVQIYAAGMRKLPPIKLMVMMMRGYRTMAGVTDSPTYRVPKNPEGDFSVSQRVARIMGRESLARLVDGEKAYKLRKTKTTVSVFTDTERIDAFLREIRRRIPTVEGKDRAALRSAEARLSAKVQDTKHEGNPDLLIQDLADFAIGMAIWSLVYGLLHADGDEPLITGSVGEYGGERDLQYRTNGGPMSIKLPGLGWRRYSGIEPLATTLAPIVDAIAAWQIAAQSSDLDGMMAASAAMKKAVFGSVRDKTFLKAVGDLVEAINHPESTSAARMLRDLTVTPMIPNVMRGSLRESDRYLRVNTFKKTPEGSAWSKLIDANEWARVALPVPGAPWTPPPLRDLWGRPIERPVTSTRHAISGDLLNFVLDMMPNQALPRTDNLQTMRADIYMKRWNDMVLTGQAPEGATTYYPSTPKVSKDYTAWEIDEVIRLSGEELTRRVQGMTFDLYNPDERTIDRLRKLVRSAQDKARRQVRRMRND